MKTKQWLKPLVFSLVAVIVIWLWVSEQAISLFSGSPINQALWDTGWHVQANGQDTRDFTAPMRLSGSENAITNVLPDPIPSFARLYVKTNHQVMRVEIDGVPVPTHGSVIAEKPLFTSDTQWSYIALDDSMAAKPIRLLFSGTGSKPYIEVYSVRFGTEARVQLALYRTSMIGMTQSLLIFLIALGLFLYAARSARRFGERLADSYVYLLLFVLVSGVWFYTYNDISGISYSDSAIFHVINVLSCFLLAPIFIQFTISAGVANRRVGRVWFASAVLMLGALFILWYTGRVMLWVAMLYLLVISALFCTLVIAYTIRHKRLCIRSDSLGVGIIIVILAGFASMVLVQFAPVTDDTMIVRYAMLVLLVTLSSSVLDANTDIIVKARKFEQLRIREEEYRIAVQQSDKHVVRYDIKTRTVLQGDRPTPLFGDAPEIADMPDSAIHNGLVAPESVDDITAFFAAMQAGKPLGMTVLRLRNQDESYAWYRANFTLVYTDDHQPVHAVISCSDITEQRERELAYQKWKQSYAEMPAGGMNYYEYNLTRDAFTGEAGKMLPPLPQDAKRTLGLMVDHLADHYVLPADDQKFRAFIQRDRLLNVNAHGVHSEVLEFRRLGGDTQPLWTQATVQLITDPYSGDVQLFLLFTDQDEQKRDALRMRNHSNTDPLTGLLNRRAFEEQFTELLSQAGPDDVHALIMVDIDGFKRVNDTYGHQFGDRVLIDVAGSLRAMMRSDDLVGRIGGDEYVICLKNVRESTGFLERRSALICQALSHQFGTDVAITGSVGLSLYPRDGHTFDELYQKADRALYYAKHHGKNRYTFYHEGLAGGEGSTPSAPPLLECDKSGCRALDRTLLIVDDVEMNRALLGEIFKDDFRLLFAENGKQCLDILLRSETPISAILLDLIMPGLSGLKVLERIQNDAYMATIPVIVTSAADEMDYGLKAIELGATDFVSKPIDARLVRLRVQNAVHKRETEELRAQNRYLLVQKNDESRHQDELRYMAEHDPLTNINNKATFYRKTRTMIDASPDTQFVMIAFDIERFRLINDIFGHEEGDRLLHYLAQRMQSFYSGRATYSRTDSDNFAICLPYDPDELHSRFLSNEAELREYDLSFDIVLVYGLYIIDDRSLPVSIMHDRAEMAKRTVKGNYVQRYAYYDDKLRQELLSELEIVNNMNTALEQGQFEVYLQPKCLLNTGEIVGAEALVRWNHPTRGVLAPGAFVPIFERNGFIMKMDAWVWEQVCRLLRKWMDDNDGHPLIPVSMNVSRVNIYNPALVNTLAELSDRYAVPRQLLELEITESAYAEDPKLLSGLVSELRTRGFPVEMDDFGSAYSSLNMLKEVSVDLLKLDMRFLYGNDQDGRGGTILSSVVRMARYLQLPVVAEGVETAEQARFLHSVGLAVGQGYYFYRPMPVDAFERLFAQRPLKPVTPLTDVYPEATMRRLWSINGDFSLMLSTIPCAASLCELSGEKIEILRINEEYLAMTSDNMERIYSLGTDVRTLTTPENYQELLALFHRALEKKGATEGCYTRLGPDGAFHIYHVKITYLSGDAVRSLFFITYNPLEGSECP